MQRDLDAIVELLDLVQVCVELREQFCDGSMSRIQRDVTLRSSQRSERPSGPPCCQDTCPRLLRHPTGLLAPSTQQTLVIEYVCPAIRPIIGLSV